MNLSLLTLKLSYLLVVNTINIILITIESFISTVQKIPLYYQKHVCLIRIVIMLSLTQRLFLKIAFLQVSCSTKASITSSIATIPLDIIIVLLHYMALSTAVNLPIR